VDRRRFSGHTDPGAVTGSTVLCGRITVSFISLTTELGEPDHQARAHDGLAHAHYVLHQQ
jgi:hypothetical protein